MSNATTVPLTRHPRALTMPRGRAVLARSNVPAVIGLRFLTGTAALRLQPGRAEVLRLQGYSEFSGATTESEEGELELTPVS